MLLNMFEIGLTPFLPFSIIPSSFLDSDLVEMYKIKWLNR